MELSDQEKIKNFRDVKRRLSVHYSIINNITEKNYFERKPVEEKTIQKRKNILKKTLIEQEQSMKHLKDIYMKNKSEFKYDKREEEEEDNDESSYYEQELDYGMVQNFLLGSYDEDFQKMLHILTSPYSERNQSELDYLLSFLINSKINETLKTDMLLTELTIPELYEYFKPYIFGKSYNFLDTIYYTGEEANNLYLVLYGSVGQYRLDIYEEEITAEEYFIFLYDCYTLYEEEMEMGFIFSEQDEPRKEYKISVKSILEDERKVENQLISDSQHHHLLHGIQLNNAKDKENDEDERQEQYIDHYLICEMVDENKDIYPLKDIGDLVRLKKIIFKLRLYMILNDSNLKDAELLYSAYEFPLTYLNFDKVLNGNVPLTKYVEILSNNFKQYDYFYLKLLGPQRHKVKLMKYVKYDENLEPYSLFGNFELINTEARRVLTTRCETEKCIVLCIDKRNYSSSIYSAQKEKRDKEIELIHSCHLFKNISKRYFKRKIYSTFQINNFFKDNILFRQNEKLTHFIFIKEGTIELSLQNMSFVEFHRLIKVVRETIIKKAKECRINLKELCDFDTKVDSKSNYNMNTIREILNQKQTFLFQRNEKGIFGDYELFFGLPALLTGTVISDKCLLYMYEYDNYKNLTYDTYLLGESLKHNSFNKLKSLLKRMIMVYNSYWKLSMEQLTKNLQEKEEIFHIMNKDEEKELSKKSLFNPINTIRNGSFKNTLYNNYNNHKVNDKNNNLLNGLSTFGRYNIFHKGNESIYHKNKTNKHDYINTVNSISINNNNNNNNNHINNKSHNNSNPRVNHSYFGKSSPIKTFVVESPKEKRIEIKNFSVKTIISNDTIMNKRYSLSRKKNNDIEKEFSNEYKTLNEGDYQKKLIKSFRQAMEAQRVASKKEKKKIFLPPIIYSNQRPINTENNIKIINSYNNKISSWNNSPFKLNKSKFYNKISLKKGSGPNLNDSLFANEKSLDKSQSIIEVENNSNKSKNNKKLYDGVKENMQKKARTRSKIRKKIDIKFAQLYNIQFRKDKKNNSIDKSFMSTN